jgi:3-hydroxyacyl-[acyl-carrier-protein] dehydratase
LRKLQRTEWKHSCVAGEFFFGGVEGLRWRKPVVPGDVLMMRVEVKKFNKRFGVCKLDAKAYVGKDLVCEAELMLIMAKEKK